MNVKEIVSLSVDVAKIYRESGECEDCYFPEYFCDKHEGKKDGTDGFWYKFEKLCFFAENKKEIKDGES